MPSTDDESPRGTMDELDLNELRARVLQNQERGPDADVSDENAVFVTPSGSIEMGRDRGVRPGTKLPPTVFACTAQ